MLAFAAAAQFAAAATDRFIPADPDFVVASLSRSAPDPELRERVVAWRADPAGDAATALAATYLERARTTREPNYIGRAEAVLAPLIERGPASQRRLYAETLQFRHDFARAEALLDAVIAADPRDTAARAQRASVRLVRGNFAGARTDCAHLVTSRDSSATVGIACFAESLAGTGDLSRGRALLGTVADSVMDARMRAYLLTVRAELAERASDVDAAITDYRAALALDPLSDPVRAALADLLLARGQRDSARRVLDVERPGLALLLRQALAAEGATRMSLETRVRDWLELERSRGDAAHHREAAMLALASGRAAEALTAARANFESQRELPDVRVLARATVAARDADARRILRSWLDSTGFDDAVTERILATSAGG
jgi:predicted Zn-dependent protease